MQRIGDGARVRVVATERALVQALRAGGGALRAQAAPLPDRWANFVRADAVAAAASASGGEPTAEAVAALAACHSAAAEILALWAALAAEEEDSHVEVAAELRRLAEFVLRGCVLGAASAADTDPSPDNAAALAGALDSAALV